MNEIGTLEMGPNTPTTGPETEMDREYEHLTHDFLEFMDAEERAKVENALVNIKTQSDPVRTHNLMKLFETLDVVSRYHPEHAPAVRKTKEVLYKTLEEIRIKEALLNNTIEKQKS